MSGQAKIKVQPKGSNCDIYPLPGLAKKNVFCCSPLMHELVNSAFELGGVNNVVVVSL